MNFNIKVEENHHVYKNDNVDLCWEVWIISPMENKELALSIVKPHNNDYYKILSHYYGNNLEINLNPWSAVLYDEIQKTYGTYDEAENAIINGINEWYNHLNEK